jgi:hypothetical protein
VRPGLVLAAVILTSGVLGRGAAAIVFHSPPPPAHARQLAIVNPYTIPGTTLIDWYKGDLQAASTWSVGKDLPRELGAYYQTHGYRFLGVADANTYTWVESYANRRLTGMPMVDATYPFGDVLAMYMDHWLPADSLQAAIDWIGQDAGFPILTTTTAAQLPVVELRKLRGVFGVEVYDGRLSLASPNQADATQQWDQLLTAGRRVYAFAADDVRSLNGQGSPASQGRGWITVLATDPSLESLLASIRQGAFYASTGPRFTGFTLTGRTICASAEGAATLRFIGSGGQLVGSGGSSACYTVTGREQYVRVEAWDSSDGRAWSQPFFLEWN